MNALAYKANTIIRQEARKDAKMAIHDLCQRCKAACMSVEKPSAVTGSHNCSFVPREHHDDGNFIVVGTV